MNVPYTLSVVGFFFPVALITECQIFLSAFYRAEVLPFLTGYWDIPEYPSVQWPCRTHNVVSLLPLQISVLGKGQGCSVFNKGNECYGLCGASWSLREKEYSILCTAQLHFPVYFRPRINGMNWLWFSSASWPVLSVLNTVPKQHPSVLLRIGVNNTPGNTLAFISYGVLKYSKVVD